MTDQIGVETVDRGLVHHREKIVQQRLEFTAADPHSSVIAAEDPGSLFRQRRLIHIGAGIFVECKRHGPQSGTVLGSERSNDVRIDPGRQEHAHWYIGHQVVA
jgi:hypothetical protein